MCLMGGPSVLFPRTEKPERRNRESNGHFIVSVAKGADVCGGEWEPPFSLSLSLWPLPPRKSRKVEFLQRGIDSFSAIGALLRQQHFTLNGH